LISRIGLKGRLILSVKCSGSAEQRLRFESCGAVCGQKRLLMTGGFVAVQSVQLNKPASRGRLIFWFYCSSTWSGLMPA